MQCRAQNADARWIFRPGKLRLGKAGKHVALRAADQHFVATESLLEVPVKDADSLQCSNGWTLQNQANPHHSPVHFSFPDLGMNALPLPANRQTHTGNAPSHNEYI